MSGLLLESFLFFSEISFSEEEFSISNECGGEKKTYKFKDSTFCAESMILNQLELIVGDGVQDGWKWSNTGR